MNVLSRVLTLPALAALALLVVPVGPAALASELTVAWAPAGDEATAGYDVEVLTLAGRRVMTLDARDATKLTITGLEDGVSYRLRVRSYDAKGRRAQRASAELVTFAGPRVTAVEDPTPVKGALRVALRGANFQDGARLVARRASLAIDGFTVIRHDLIVATLRVADGAPAAGPADFLVVNPVRRADDYLRAHPELFDVDGSGAADAADAARIAAALGATRGTPRYDEALDLDGDGTVGTHDADLMSGHLRDASAPQGRGGPP